jgi:hypothetical protein
MNYVLPNRKAFADSITRIFLKYRQKDKDPLDTEDKDVDLCRNQAASNTRELYPYQVLIRDYLMIETPYRGILLYHGLGSGKTCSSIAVAESLLSNLKVFVLLPASLQINYRGELRKCGNPIYAFDQEWVPHMLSDDNRAQAKALGISDKFLDKRQQFFTTVAGGTPNYMGLPPETKKLIGLQIEDIIDQRFNFINYNGLSRASVKELVPEDGPNPFDNSVVIVDEIHNLISSISGQVPSEIRKRLYDAIYNAKKCKIVALSGTPVINRPNEIANLMNLLRGPIERITIPFKTSPTWDETQMTSALRKIPDIDTIEFNAVKKYLMVTRNPPNFKTVYNEKGDRIAVKYDKDMAFVPIAADWVSTWKTKFETEIGGGELAVERVSVEMLECLPSKYEEFAATFLNGLDIKNPLLFQRRIQGLVSYFKGADERLIPKRVDDDKMLEKIPMSKEQFLFYLERRWIEMKMDSRKGRGANELNDDKQTFRVLTRLACDYAVPPDLRTIKKKKVEGEVEVADENSVPDEPETIEKLRANPMRYLSEEALTSFSPKMLKMLHNIKETNEGGWKNQFVYSQYRSLEGLGVFSAILDTNGWQPYKIKKNGIGQWEEDAEMDAEKPAYAFYTGEENSDQREFMRQIFNGRFEDSMPPSLKASVEARGKRLLCLLMASSSGAEGITLANVRRVHIMEPHWTPARHDQVIGRAIRICSHTALEPPERTVRISFYISVFTEEQQKTADFPNIVAIRRNDTSMKRYDGTPVESFMSTDEYLYEIAYEKERISQKISLLLKQAAVDCEIHRKLHGREKPVLSCMRFDTMTTSEDMAFKPSLSNEPSDKTMERNTTRRHRNLQEVSIQNRILLFDTVSKELFDGAAFQDGQRLLRLGYKVNDRQIRWLLT